MADFSNTRIQFRRGTAQQWSDAAPVILGSGEPGFITDTNTLKIGDGTTAFASLSAITGGGGGGSEINDLSSVVTWANVPDANITESSVVQHSGALQITESQITDFGTYLTAVADDTSPFLGGSLTLDQHDINVEVRNDSGSDINAGTPVYIAGYHAGSSKPLIAPADASSTSTMPAFGIVENTITNGNEGVVAVLGIVAGVDTTSPVSFSVNDVVYVAAGGGLTNIKPTGVSEQIQNLGKVTKVHASDGRILLLGAGRSNDVPNSGDFSALTVDSAPVVVSDTTGITGASGISNIVYMTQAAYTALGSYDADTLYYIV